MGTRRSKHNKGVKPLYKEHRLGISDEGRPFDLEWNAFTKYIHTHFPDGPSCPNCGSKDHYLIKSRKKFKCADCYTQYAPTQGTPFHAHKLSYEKINKIEAMKPCGATELAERLGLTYRGAWMLKDRLAKHSASWATIVHQARADALAYPYIRKSNSEAELILRVNKLVPQSVGYDRGDICQDILLAVLDGRHTIEQFESDAELVRMFSRGFKSANREQSGHAKALYNEEWNQPEVYSNIAAREWWQGQQEQTSSYMSSFFHYQSPTQIEDAYNSELIRIRRKLSERGIFISEIELIERLEIIAARNNNS